MTHDTAKDPRILVAEVAVKWLKRYVGSKSMKKPSISKSEVDACMSNIESNIMAMKYCYLEPSAIAGGDMARQVEDNARRLRDGLGDSLTGMPPMAGAGLSWALGVLSGLGRRFRNRGDKPSCGIDILAVKVRNINQAGKLWVTRSLGGQEELTIVTNMEGIEQGDSLYAALLPPVELAGTVSRAMFLGREAAPEEPGTIMDPAEMSTKEADSLLYNEMQKR